MVCVVEKCHCESAVVKSLFNSNFEKRKYAVSECSVGWRYVASDSVSVRKKSAVVANASFGVIIIVLRSVIRNLKHSNRRKF